MYVLVCLVVLSAGPYAGWRAFTAGAGPAPVLPAAVMDASAPVPKRPPARATRADARVSTPPRFGPKVPTGRFGFNWPVSGSHAITSPFGPRGKGFHHGADIACGMGQPIYAARAGRVTFATAARAYGNVVLIDHGGGYVTLSAHLSRIDVVPGQQVGRLQQIGLCGDSGKATGPHLHLELRHRGYVWDPVSFLP